MELADIKFKITELTEGFDLVGESHLMRKRWRTHDPETQARIDQAAKDLASRTVPANQRPNQAELRAHYRRAEKIRVQLGFQ